MAMSLNECKSVMAVVIRAAVRSARCRAVLTTMMHSRQP